MSVDRSLARDRELRAHATARPWHQEGQGTRFRLVGPLPRSPVVADPYLPNPQDAPLLLHRVNTYEELETRDRTAPSVAPRRSKTTRYRAGRCNDAHG